MATTTEQKNAEENSEATRPLAIPSPAATMEQKNAAENSEPTRPLALPSPSVHPAACDEEGCATASRWRSMQYLRKRRSVFCCCGCCVTTVVIVGIVILVLSLTVFKIKDPILTMNSVTLSALNGGIGNTNNPVSVNATIAADLTIKNPNVASFKFGRSETDLYLKGQSVGVAYAPEGKVGADRSVRMNVTVDVLTDRLVSNVNVTGIVFGQEYDLTSYTGISGRVSVFGIYKRDVDIKMNCSIALEIGSLASSVQAKSVDCIATVS